MNLLLQPTVSQRSLRIITLWCMREWIEEINFLQMKIGVYNSAMKLLDATLSPFVTTRYFPCWKIATSKTNFSTAPSLPNIKSHVLPTIVFAVRCSELLLLTCFEDISGTTIYFYVTSIVSSYFQIMASSSTTLIAPVTKEEAPSILSKTQWELYSFWMILFFVHFNCLVILSIFLHQIQALQ